MSLVIEEKENVFKMSPIELPLVSDNEDITMSIPIRTNIKELVSEIKLANSPYLPVFEAVINSIQSIFELQKINPKIGRGKITITLERETEDTESFNFNNKKLKSIHIEDNGIGFTNTNYESFRIFKTTQKKFDYGGKGVGRFTWLAAFQNVHVDSNYYEKGIFRNRKFEFSIKVNGVKTSKSDENLIQENKTVVSLNKLEEQFQSRYKKSNKEMADLIIEHILPFLVLFNKCPLIYVQDNSSDKPLELNKIFLDEIKEKSQKGEKEIADGLLKVNIYEIRGKRDSDMLYFYADNRVIDDESTAMEKIIPDFKSITHLDIKGCPFNYAIYATHPNFNFMVDEYRTGFKKGQPGLYGDFELLKEETIKIIQAILADELLPLEEIRMKKVLAYIEKNPKYAHLSEYPDLLKKIIPVDSNRHMEMQFHEIFYTQKENADSEFRNILKENLNDPVIIKRFEKIVSKVDRIKKSELAEYVAYRRMILEIFADSLRQDIKTGKYLNEDIMHNLIFPRHTNNEEIEYLKHNLWLLDDRFSFYQEIYSDNNSNTGEKEQRTDLILFDKLFTFGEGDLDKNTNSITIIEFKKPGRDDYTYDKNPIYQIRKYEREIWEAGEIVIRGRKRVVNESTPFYLNVVCDFTPSFHKTLNARDEFFKPFPGKDGYYYFSGMVIINIYSYEKVLNDAKHRNNIFFKTLGIDK